MKSIYIYNHRYILEKILPVSQIERTENEDLLKSSTGRFLQEADFEMRICPKELDCRVLSEFTPVGRKKEKGLGRG